MKLYYQSPYQPHRSPLPHARACHSVLSQESDYYGMHHARPHNLCLYWTSVTHIAPAPWHFIQETAKQKFNATYTFLFFFLSPAWKVSGIYLQLAPNTQWEKSLWSIRRHIMLSFFFLFSKLNGWEPLWALSSGIQLRQVRPVITEHPTARFQHKTTTDRYKQQRKGIGWHEYSFLENVSDCAVTRVGRVNVVHPSVELLKGGINLKAGVSSLHLTWRAEPTLIMNHICSKPHHVATHLHKHPVAIEGHEKREICAVSLEYELN